MKIHPRLEADSVHIKNLELSELRLLKDGELDWFLLIPRVENCTEIFDLSSEQQQTLMFEINMVSQHLQESSSIDKVNIASIGNIVSQMHVHIIGRKHNDRAWPGVVWGTASKEVFNEKRAQYWVESLR